MTVTQEMLMRQIAKQEELDFMTVKQMFHALEHVTAHFLKTASPTETVVVKLFKGLSLECRYVPETTAPNFNNIHCPPKIKAKPKLTRYYNEMLNT